jgi:hypothetical protein
MTEHAELTSSFGEQVIDATVFVDSATAWPIVEHWFLALRAWCVVLARWREDFEPARPPPRLCFGILRQLDGGKM